MKNTLNFYLIAVVLLIIAVAGYFYIRYDEIPYLWEKDIVVDSTKIKNDSILALKKDSVKKGGRTRTKTKPKDDFASFPVSNQMFAGDTSGSVHIIEQPADTTTRTQSGISSNGVTSGSSTLFSTNAKERKKLLKLYESMSAEKIAELLDMTKDDNTVREIIFMLKERKASKVLQLLPPERVQKILGLKKDIY